MSQNYTIPDSYLSPLLQSRGLKLSPPPSNPQSFMARQLKGWMCQVGIPGCNVHERLMSVRKWYRNDNGPMGPPLCMSQSYTIMHSCLCHPLWGPNSTPSPSFKGDGWWVGGVRFCSCRLKSTLTELGQGPVQMTVSAQMFSEQNVSCASVHVHTIAFSSFLWLMQW